MNSVLVIILRINYIMNSIQDILLAIGLTSK